MTDLEVFSCGFGGSAALEVLAAYQFYIDPSQGGLPQRYKMWGFWFVRVLLACMGGGLAVAYEIDQRILAVNIGASAPLIMAALAQGIRGHQEIPATRETTDRSRKSSG